MADKPIMIFDTDMDTDCDDAGALVMLLHAAREGRISLCGVIVDAPVKEAAPCCEAFCRFYGMDVPVGTVYEDDLLAAPRFAHYADQRRRAPDSIFYNRALAAQLGKRDTDYPEAVTLYRRLLAQAEDKSVTIVCVGFMTALGRLLLSGPDELSPLSGMELVRQKVLRVVSMGELPTEGDRCTTFNYAMDQEGTEAAFENCPVPICISPAGTHVITGAHLSDALPANHPLRVAYDMHNGPGKGRSSWDLIAVLHALEPDSPHLHLEPLGTVHADAAAQRMWCDPQGVRQDQLVVSDISDDQMACLLNAMLC